MVKNFLRGELLKLDPKVSTTSKGNAVRCLPYLRIEQDYATMGETGTAKDREKEFHEVLKKARKNIEQTLR